MSFGFPPGGPAQYSPKGPFLSEALDFTDSVRASKFQRFELVGELQQEQVFTLLSHGETPENEFIELNRTFHELSEHAGKSDDVDLSQVFHIKSNLTWNDVLKIPRTVILSEAGSGKTQEIRRVAERLREEGKAAFFLRLELIPDDFDIAFEVGTYEQFKAWIASGETGWMLLDSVDDLCEGQDYRAVPKWTGVDLRMPEALLPSNQSQNNPTPKIAETARKAQAQIQTKQRSYIECVSWLESIMRVSPEIRTEAKRRLRAQAQSKWPKKFGFRAFEAAWTEAVAKAEAPVWSTAGRPRKSTRP